MDYLRTLQMADCPIDALRSVAWLSIMKAAEEFAATPNPTGVAHLGERGDGGRFDIVGGRWNPSFQRQRWRQRQDGGDDGTVVVPVSRRPLTLYATEATDRPVGMSNTQCRRFWFATNSVVSFGHTGKRYRECEDDASTSSLAADQKAARMRRTKKVSFFMSRDSACTVDGDHIPLPAEEMDNERGSMTGPSPTIDGDVSVRRRCRIPDPIVLSKAEISAELTVSAFAYEASRRFRTFVNENSAFRNMSSGATPSVKSVTDAARMLAEALARSAGTIVPGHVVALSRISDGDARIPTVVLSDVPWDDVGLHQAPLVDQWCSAEEMKAQIATFLLADPKDARLLVRMLQVPMAPLKKEK
jgi:hypothetical protein